jgi:ribosomal-protein-alanine N-acetyltransferase
VTVVPPLETRRLLLLPLDIADAPQIQRLFPDWEIVQYMSSVIPWPYPPDGAVTYIHDVALPAMARGDEWIWTIRLKEMPAQLVGSIGLKQGDDENRGFWLGRDWQRRGLMTESSNAATDYWFDALGFPRLRVPKALANAASRRISEKQGMRVVAAVERDYVSGRLPAEIWEITAEEWQTLRLERARFERSANQWR